MTASPSTLVCTNCFEKYGEKKNKATSLLQLKCLKRSSHKYRIEVNVHMTDDGILEPEIRPTPKTDFKGEFVLCSAKKCRARRGKTCTYSHCMKEKEAWNAEKSPSDESTSSATGQSCQYKRVPRLNDPPLGVFLGKICLLYSYYHASMTILYCLQIRLKL